MSRKYRYQPIATIKGMVSDLSVFFRVIDTFIQYFLYSNEKIGNLESKMKVEQADQFAEMSMVEVTKALAKMWRELDAEKKNKVIKSFEKVI